jgi:hypothetical protein
MDQDARGRHVNKYANPQFTGAHKWKPDSGDEVVWQSPDGEIWAQYEDGHVLEDICWIVFQNQHTGEVERALVCKQHLTDAFGFEEEQDEINFAPPGYLERDGTDLYL